MSRIHIFFSALFLSAFSTNAISVLEYGFDGRFYIDPINSSQTVSNVQPQPNYGQVQELYKYTYVLRVNDHEYFSDPIFKNHACPETINNGKVAFRSSSYQPTGDMIWVYQIGSRILYMREYFTNISCDVYYPSSLMQDIYKTIGDRYYALYERELARGGILGYIKSRMFLAIANDNYKLQELHSP